MMKKTILTTVTALALMFSVNIASAQGNEEIVESQQQVIQQEDDYQQIQADQLPAAVQQAVEQQHQGSQISEVYLKEKEGQTTYKLVLTTQDGQTQEVFSDAEGKLTEEDNK